MAGYNEFLRRGFFAALFICVLVVGAGAQSGSAIAENFKTPLVVEKTDGTLDAFQVELALTNVQRSQGLMHRKKLAPGDGMLFIFPDSNRRSFWMRNTIISLDIIFIAADGHIVNIVAEAEPLTDTPRPSTGPAKAVLEIVGGRAAELGITPGDIVRHALLGNMKPIK